MTDLERLPPLLQAVNCRPLFVMNLAVNAVHVPGGPEGAERRVGDIAGGTFSGERLSGEVLPGGTDWQIARADGALTIDARVVLRTGDGALIAMDYGGLRHGPAETMARIAKGETVNPASYYFRTVPRFSTSAPRYEWLNRIIAIGIGHRLAGGPVYSIFELL